MTPEALVRSVTTWEAVPFVAEITLLTAAGPSGLWDLWDRTRRDAPPFWAFPWAGGQALARYVLDNPATVAGRRVLDLLPARTGRTGAGFPPRSGRVRR